MTTKQIRGAVAVLLIFVWVLFRIWNPPIMEWAQLVAQGVGVAVLSWSIAVYTIKES